MNNSNDGIQINYVIQMLNQIKKGLEVAFKRHKMKSLHELEVYLRY